MPRPGYNVTTAAGASDLAGSMAAAFAASALVFQESDPTFATQLQTAAVDLYGTVRIRVHAQSCLPSPPPLCLHLGTSCAMPHALVLVFVNYNNQNMHGRAHRSGPGTGLNATVYTTSSDFYTVDLKCVG